MSAFMSSLFHRGRTEEGSGEVTRTSRLSKEETGQERPMESSTAEGGPGTGLTQRSAGPHSLTSRLWHADRTHS
jgi:hypothetical protein